MSKVILICGKVCSGKTYYAKKLKEDENAVILSLDEATYYLIDNVQNEKFRDFVKKASIYLRKKSVDIVRCGITVILDWGFWTAKERKDISLYFKQNNVNYEWHYIDIDDKIWLNNIDKRNNQIKKGLLEYEFSVGEGLKEKMKNIFEKPTKEEIDIWINGRS